MHRIISQVMAEVQIEARDVISLTMDIPLQPQNHIAKVGVPYT